MDFHEIMVTLVIVVVVMMVSSAVLFPGLFQKSIDARQTRNDVVMAFSSGPTVNVTKSGGGYVYTLSSAVQGEYKGDYHKGAARRIDVEAFVTFKGKTVRALIGGQNYFSVSKGNNGKSEFSNSISANIISSEPPIKKVTSPFKGEIVQGGTLIVDNSFSVTLDSTKVNLLGRIPLFGDNVCWGYFTVACGGKFESDKLRECGPAYDCTRETNMCGGTLDIGINKITCGEGVGISLSSKGGAASDVQEELYISFWEKGADPSCVDQFKEDYSGISKLCQADFLGDYTAKIGLLEGAQ